MLACGWMGVLESVGITNGSASLTTSSTPPTRTTKQKKKNKSRTTSDPDSASLASLTLEEID